MVQVSREPPVLLRYAFRPFFLLTGIYAILLIVAWVGFLAAGWPLPPTWSALSWHSHEMLYGWVPAAIAGFVLTAITNWTPARPLQGSGLLLLILLWLAGRLSMWFAGFLPAWWVAGVDLAFLPVLATYVAATLRRHGNRRNLILVAVMLVLAAGNLLMHLGAATANTRLLTLGQLQGFDLITLLMLVIGGRIIPAFSANWLRARGANPDRVKQFKAVDLLALGSVILLLPLSWSGAPVWLQGGIALLAAAANLVRLWGWAGWQVRAEPLLSILHLAYGATALALLLRGLSAFNTLVPASAWQHLLGVGGIATLILGVMTRVALGHTGRPLQLPPFALWSYGAMVMATLLRLAVALHWLDFQVGIVLAAANWVLAFSLFILAYWPILTQPRADGRVG